MVPAELTIRRQWVVWRYEERAGKASKVPYQLDGSLASTTDPATWTTFEIATDAVATDTRQKWSGVGFVFTPEDDLIGIDLDNCLSAGEVLQPAAAIIERLASYAEVSPSGNGVKVFVRGRLPDNCGRKVSLPNGIGLEVYPHSRYFTVTADVLGNRNDVTIQQDAIDWLAATYLPKHKPADTPVATLPASSIPPQHRLMDRARAYMAKYPPAISGNDGHGVTFRLACVLVNGFCLDAGNAFTLLGEYNLSCQPPWSDTELSHKIDSAGANADGRVGYMLTEHDPNESAVPIKTSERSHYEVYMGDLLRSLDRKTTESGLPADLLDVPGFVGDVASWITTQNPRPNRVLSLLGAVALQSVLCGRKVRDVSGNRTNIYIVALAPSGGGKQAPQSCIKRLLAAVDGADLFSGKVASDSALAQDLLDHPARLFLWDEFGRFLEKTQMRGESHLLGVQESLLELWGEAGGLWKHKSLAISKFSRHVQQPNCSVLGLTVPSRFWFGLDDSHMLDGFAARLLVVDSGAKVKPNSDVVESPPPDDVVEIARHWREFQPGGNLAAEFPVPLVVQESPEARAEFLRLVERQETVTDERDNVVWSRAIEKAKRLALIYACSVDHESPSIDHAAASWACRLVIWSTQTFLGQARDEITSDGFGRRYKRILDLIREFTGRKQQCTRTHLLRSTKWRAKELDEVIGVLTESDLIDIMSAAGKGGRPTTFYVAL